MSTLFICMQWTRPSAFHHSKRMGQTIFVLQLTTMWIAREAATPSLKRVCTGMGFLVFPVLGIVCSQDVGIKINAELYLKK